MINNYALKRKFSLGSLYVVTWLELRIRDNELIFINEYTIDVATTFKLGSLCIKSYSFIPICS